MPSPGSALQCLWVCFSPEQHSVCQWLSGEKNSHQKPPSPAITNYIRMNAYYYYTSSLKTPRWDRYATGGLRNALIQYGLQKHAVQTVRLLKKTKKTGNNNVKVSPYAICCCSKWLRRLIKSKVRSRRSGGRNITRQLLYEKWTMLAGIYLLSMEK